MISILSISLVFLFILIEYSWVRIKNKKNVFHFPESISNLSIGIFERSLYLLLYPVTSDVFNWLHQHSALPKINSNPLSFVGLLLATDFVWYWYHRLGHQINIFWAAHIVHHQSNDFNYTVAARITIFQAIVRSFFWCLLPIAGFTPETVMGVLVFHGAYSFFTHTRQIPKLKWLEHVFITPSLHRVHHASNEKYLDKNYGDLFVFWDKLFGTFKAEEEEPTYGLTHPIKSRSFLWQHFHYFLEIGAMASRKKSVKEKIKVWFDSPMNMEPDIRDQLEKKWLLTSNKSIYGRLGIYVILQVILAVVLLSLLIEYKETISWISQLGIIISIFLTLVIAGAILEQKKILFEIELLRIICCIIVLCIAYELYYLIPISISSILVLCELLNIKKWYTHQFIRIS